MSKLNLQEILQLPVPERLDLLEKIWDSLAAHPEELPLTPAQREELQRRLKAEAENPDAVETWPEVKARIRGRRD